MEQRTITFNEAEHSYTDELGNRYISVTQLIGKVTPEFNRRFWLVYKALEGNGSRLRPDTRNNRINLNGIDYDIDLLYKNPDVVAKIKVIDKNWTDIKDEACERGTAEHNYLEGTINGFTRTDKIPTNKILDNKGYKYKIVTIDDLDRSTLKDTHPFVYQKLVWYIEKGWVIFAEKRVYSSVHLIAGSIDLLIINLKTKEFVIFDWKTNKKDLQFVSGYYKKEFRNGVKIETDEFVFKDERLLSPVNNLQKCKGMEYTLQLSMYAYLCELWGFKCVGLYLFHLKPGLIIPPILTIDYKKEEAINLFEWNKNGCKTKVTFGVK